MSEAQLPPPADTADHELAAAHDELGAAVRRMLDVVVTTDLSVAGVLAATNDVEALTERLGGLPPRRRLQDNPFHPTSLVGGTAHPVAPQVGLRQIEDGVTGTVTLGQVFEGGPGLVHGGILALIFDHAMGAAVYLGGNAAMTTGLRVSYLAPTKLHTALTVTARIDQVDGRKVHVAAQIAAGDTVTATAEAVFVRLTMDNVSRIFADQREALGG